MITLEWVSELKRLIDAANLDSAITHIADVHPLHLDRDLDPRLPPRARLRAKCLICEVYDYAAKREEANECIEKERRDLLEDLKNAKRAFEKGGWEKTWDKLEALANLKQECWALLHLGMVAHYRAQDYGKAREYFEIARDVLLHINDVNRHGVRSIGALARAYYCLGLVDREEHNLYDARKNFSDSIACAWVGIIEKPADHPSVPFLKYSIGRALGLGMAWIAYTRATMSEATAHIVGARLLLKGMAGLKYLSRYVDIVHGCTERSRADNVMQVEKAIKEISDAFEDLGGKAILDKGDGAGHLVYAQRAAYELATAHVGASRLYGREVNRLEAKMAETQEEREEALKAGVIVVSGTVAKRHAVGEAKNGTPESEQRFGNLQQGIALAEQRRETHLNAALGCINDVAGSLRWTDPKTKDKRTRCNVLITKSRVSRELGELDRALAQAQEAAEIGVDHPLSRIDCWITLGEVHYQRGEYELALREFEKARGDRRAQTNPKVLAVCDLQMALCYLKRRQIDMAQKLFSDWEDRGSQGQHNSFVRHLAEEVAQQLAAAAFVISGDTTDEELSRVLAKAELWVIELALKRHQGEKRCYDKVGEVVAGLTSGKALKNRLKKLREEVNKPNKTALH